MSKFKVGEKEASNEFLGVLMGGGSPMVDCICGRTHYAPDSQFITEREKENYLACHADNPDQFHIQYDTDYIEYKTLYNMAPYVIDCPCNSYYPYEKFIWTERATIRKYLSMVKLRLQMELDSVESWSEDL